MVFIERETVGAMTPPGKEVEELPVEDIEAGTIADLPPGAKVSDWRPNYPDAALEGFNSHMLVGGAAGLEVAYSTLTGDVARANYSSLRAGLGGERDGWRIFQRDLWEGLHAEVFRQWLPVAVLSGELDFPMARLEAGHVRGATWFPRGWEPVNPKEDAVATETELEAGARALSDVLRRRGDTVERLVRRVKRDRAAFEAAGLPLPAWMRGEARRVSSAPGGEPSDAEE